MGCIFILRVPTPTMLLPPPCNTCSDLADAGRISSMKHRGIRLLFLLWLSCYLSGPLCETFDFWDTPQEEMQDINRTAGGAVPLIAVIFCFAIASFQKFRERSLCFSKAIQAFLLLTILQPTFTLFASEAGPTPSPPAPLRI